MAYFVPWIRAFKTYYARGQIPLRRCRSPRASSSFQAVDKGDHKIYQEPDTSATLQLPHVSSSLLALDTGDNYMFQRLNTLTAQTSLSRASPRLQASDTGIFSFIYLVETKLFRAMKASQLSFFRVSRTIRRQYPPITPWTR